MKIAFWSNAYEKTGAFLNFAAVSIAGVMWYPYTITVLKIISVNVIWESFLRP